MIPRMPGFSSKHFFNFNPRSKPGRCHSTQPIVPLNNSFVIFFPSFAIAIAAAKDGKKITQELFNGTIGWVEWQRPGFDLGLKLKKCLDENPGIRGIMLGSHGLFTWGDTAYESYINTLEVIERCAQYLEDNYGKKRAVFGGKKIQSLPKEERLSKAASLAPVLRGFCSSQIKMIGHFTDDD